MDRVIFFNNPALNCETIARRPKLSRTIRYYQFLYIILLCAIRMSRDNTVWSNWLEQCDGALPSLFPRQRVKRVSLHLARDGWKSSESLKRLVHAYPRSPYRKRSR